MVGLGSWVLAAQLVIIFLMINQFMISNLEIGILTIKKGIRVIRVSVKDVFKF